MDSIRELLDSVSPEDLERLKSVAQNLMQDSGSGGGQSGKKRGIAPKRE